MTRWRWVPLVLGFACAGGELDAPGAPATGGNAGSAGVDAGGAQAGGRAGAGANGAGTAGGAGTGAGNTGGGSTNAGGNAGAGGVSGAADTGGVGGAPDGGPGGGAAGSLGGGAPCLANPPGAPELMGMLVGNSQYTSLAVDEKNVYWGRWQQGITAVPKGGGPAHTVAIDAGEGTFSLIEGYLYTTGVGGKLYRVSVYAVNGAFELYADQAFGTPMVGFGEDIVMPGAKRLITKTKQIVDLDPEGGTIADIGSVATDGTSLYWEVQLYAAPFQGQPEKEARWIRKLTPGKAVTTVVTETKFLPGMDFSTAQAGKNHVCFVSDNFTCYDLQTWNEIVPNGVSGETYAIDEPYLYSESNVGACFGITRIGLDDSSRVLFWPNNQAVGAIVTDADYVYFVIGDNLYRKHK